MENTNSPVLQAALDFAAAGISCVFIRSDGSKAPAYEWDAYKSLIAAPDELRRMFRSSLGVAIIGGEVSGGLEILDSDETPYAAYMAACKEAGIGDLLKSLPLWQTPSYTQSGGGWQLCYRCPEGRAVTGNKKLAQRKVTLTEKSPGSRPDADGTWYKVETVMETRGEGGYACVPPTPAACHPANKPYVMRRGSLLAIPVLSLSERESLLAVARSFNTFTPPVAARREYDKHEKSASGELTPWDDYDARGDYQGVLERHGWKCMGHRGEKDEWQRPGKGGDGISGTTNYGGSRMFYTWSSNAYPFEPETSYFPFRVYAILEHGSDFSAAAKALMALGYGTPRSPRTKQDSLKQEPLKQDLLKQDFQPKTDFQQAMQDSTAARNSVAKTVPEISPAQGAGSANGQSPDITPTPALNQAVDPLKRHCASSHESGNTEHEGSSSETGDTPAPVPLPADVEQAVLWCCFKFETCRDVAGKRRVEASDFAITEYGATFAAILSLHSAHGAVDRVSVAAVSGSEAITAVAAISDDYNELLFDVYLSEVMKRSTKRRLLDAINESTADAYSDMTGEEAVTAALGRFQEVKARAAQDDGPVKLSDTHTEVIDRLEALALSPETRRGIPFGLKDVNNFVGDMEPGQTYVIMARPSCGKSSSLSNIVASACGDCGESALLFSLETPKEQFAIRMACWEAGVQAKHIKRGTRSDDDFERYYAACKNQHSWNLWVDDKPGLNIIDMEARCREIKRTRGLGLVMVDYVQLMSPHKVFASRAHEVESYMRGLSELAMNLEVPVVICSQISRAVDSRSDARPTMADGKESGSIEEKANVVIGLYRESLYKKHTAGETIDPTIPEECEWIVLKNKDGERGSVKVSFVPAYAKFRDFSIMDDFGNTGF